MNEPQDRDWLDSLLQRAEDEIEDAGFSSRVLQALPPQPGDERFRYLVLMAFAAAASVLCFFLLPAGNFVWESVRQVFNPNAWITASVSIGSMVMVAMIVWGALSIVTASDI
jgi:hypothetical protein